MRGAHQVLHHDVGEHVAGDGGDALTQDHASIHAGELLRMKNFAIHVVSCFLSTLIKKKSNFPHI